MIKKLTVALAVQLIAAFFLILPPLGYNEAVERFGKEAELKVESVSVYGSYDDDGSSRYQLDMRLVSDGTDGIKYRISSSGSEGDYIYLERYDGKLSGYCIYHLDDELSEAIFISFPDSGYNDMRILDGLARNHNMTVRIKCFRNHAVVENVLVDGEEFDSFIRNNY